MRDNVALDRLELLLGSAIRGQIIAGVAFGALDLGVLTAD